MDVRGRAKDNIWIERFWKTIKYEYIYIHHEENSTDLFFEIKRFIDDYNFHRRHQGADAASERRINLLIMPSARKKRPQALINRTVPSKLYIRQAAWS